MIHFHEASISYLVTNGRAVMQQKSIEERAILALAIPNLAIFRLNHLALNESSLQSPALHHGDLIALAVYDDSPIDDDQLCVLFKAGTQWYIGFQGHRQVFTQLVGQDVDVNTATVSAMLQILWARVKAKEGGIRRQG